MTPPRRLQAAGVLAGMALFVAFGLTLMTGAQRSPRRETDSAPPLTPAVTEPARALGRAFAAVAAHVRPAVVSVYSEKMVKYHTQPWQFPFGDDFFHHFFGDQSPGDGPGARPREYRVPERGMGSGMIIDRRGHILTNHHVVSDVDEIRVTLADGRSFEAEIVGADPKMDVAIIQIKGAVPDGLPTVDLGDSEKLDVGDWVLAVGAPFGLAQTVTAGIVSATGRDDVGIADYEDFIQTDAAINPGNSGGPLVNMDGQVVGINTAIATSVGQYSGVGFAIPIDMARTVLPTLLKGGIVTRGVLGVVIQEMTRDLARHFHLPEAHGALVSQVGKDSPAARAGIQVGDVIWTFDGRPVTDTRHLRNMVAATAPGKKVPIGVYRNGREISLTAILGTLKPDGESPAEPAEKANPLEPLGLTLHPLTPELARSYGYEDQTGVLVAAVEEGSPAAAAHLQAGDLIVEINRRPVAGLADVRAAMEGAPDRVLLLVKRKDASLFVVVPMP